MERFHRTLKELLRLTTIPEDQTAFERELELIIDWYNEHRPHETLPHFPRKREEKVERGPQESGERSSVG
ncbi:MAG: integrase core domain-containing protein [Pirellulaceae bacterium]